MGKMIIKFTIQKQHFVYVGRIFLHKRFVNVESLLQQNTA